VIWFVKTDWNGQSLFYDRTLVLTLLVGSGVFCFLFCLREQLFDMFFALFCGGENLAQPTLVERLFIQVHTVLKENREVQSNGLSGPDIHFCPLREH